jgi:hypothetical protein
MPVVIFSILNEQKGTYAMITANRAGSQKMERRDMRKVEIRYCPV